MSNPAATPQSAPVSGSQSVYDLVVKDLSDRREFGISKYGRELEVGNGRDALMDAYQVALDLVMYLRQALEERANQ